MNYNQIANILLSRDINEQSKKLDEIYVNKAAIYLMSNFGISWDLSISLINEDCEF